MVTLQMMKRCGGDIALTHADGTVQDDSGAVNAQRLHGLHHELALESPLRAFILPFGFFERSPLFADRQDFADDLLELVKRLLQEGYKLGRER